MLRITGIVCEFPQPPCAQSIPIVERRQPEEAKWWMCGVDHFVRCQMTLSGTIVNEMLLFRLICSNLRCALGVAIMAPAIFNY